MRSTVKTHFAGDLADVLPIVVEKLEAAGCSVYDAWDGYRVLMFRKSAHAWTQGYTGTTKSGRRRTFLRWAGPETGLIAKLGLENVDEEET